MLTIKKLKAVVLVMAIVLSIVVSSVSVYKIYTLIKEKHQATDILKYASDVTIDEDKKFANNLNYLNAANEYKAKKYGSAILELNEQIIKNPQHAQSYYLLGKIYEEAIFDDGAYYSKMADNYEKYILLKPKGKRINDAKIKAAQYFIYLGLTQKLPQYLEKAENYLKTLDQSDSAVKMSLGAIYLDKQNYEQAITAFEKSTNFSISEMKLKYNSLGLAYLKRRDYTKAENAFEIAIRMNPQSKYAHNNLGVAYVKQGKLIAAQQQFLEALTLDPEYRKAHVNKIWTDTEILRKKGVR